MVETPKHTCEQCALPLTEAGICGECLSTQPAFDETICSFYYEAPIDRLIHQFKFQRHIASGHWLGDQLAQTLQQMGAQADLLLPVPLHWRRQWYRGFSQSAVIAQRIHRALPIPLTHAVSRIQHTPHQRGLSLKARASNVKKSFRVEHPSIVKDAHIAIIDDVVTTGATVNALAKSLKHAGARRVSIWAIARTPANKTL